MLKKQKIRRWTGGYPEIPAAIQRSVPWESLTVGADEKAETLSVTAGLRSYNKTASAVVTVKQIQTGLAVDFQKKLKLESCFGCDDGSEGMSGQIRFYVDKAAVGSPITSTGGETPFTIEKTSPAGNT